MSGITKINGQSGSAQKCIEYLEGMTQSNGNDRDFAPVNEISGDKNLFLAVAESTERKNKYVSGTISFQQPLTEQQFKSVIKEFHQTFLPELKQGEDFADYWNIHQKKNGQFELNFAIATTHIKSGKQLNPFPPGMESRELKDLFDSVVNHELGLNQVNQIEIKLDENGNPIKTDSYSFQNPMKTSTYNLLKQFNSIKVKNEDGKLVLPENKTDFFKQLKSMQQQKDFVKKFLHRRRRRQFAPLDVPGLFVWLEKRTDARFVGSTRRGAQWPTLCPQHNPYDSPLLLPSASMSFTSTQLP